MLNMNDINILLEPGPAWSFQWLNDIDQMLMTDLILS